MPVAKIPSFYEIYEIGLFLFLIVVFSVYRKKVFEAIREFVYDIIFAVIFSGAVLTFVNISNPTNIAILFIASLAIIFSSRIIYNRFYGNNGMPNMPRMPT